MLLSSGVGAQLCHHGWWLHLVYYGFVRTRKTATVVTMSAAIGRKKLSSWLVVNLSTRSLEGPFHGAFGKKLLILFVVCLFLCCRVVLCVWFQFDELSLNPKAIHSSLCLRSTQHVHHVFILYMDRV